jgi:hypothetical protein
MRVRSDNRRRRATSGNRRPAPPRGLCENYRAHHQSRIVTTTTIDSQFVNDPVTTYCGYAHSTKNARSGQKGTPAKHAPTTTHLAVEPFSE